MSEKKNGILKKHSAFIFWLCRTCFKNVFFIWTVFLEKDVNRTDRTNKFYEGEDNPGLILLHDILMTYCMYDFDLGKLCSSERKSLFSFWYAALLMVRPANTIELLLMAMLFVNVKMDILIMYITLFNFSSYFFLSSVWCLSQASGFISWGGIGN